MTYPADATQMGLYTSGVAGGGTANTVVASILAGNPVVQGIVVDVWVEYFQYSVLGPANNLRLYINGINSGSLILPAALGQVGRSRRRMVLNQFASVDGEIVALDPSLIEVRTGSAALLTQYSASIYIEPVL